MKSAEKSMKYWWLAFGLLALAIISYVLFQYPQPGIADQGDFDRIMNVSGLRVPLDNLNDPNFVRFLKYPVTDYQIYNLNILNLVNRWKTTSLTYLITLVSSICKLFGHDTFKTGYLAIAYSIMYVTAMYVTVKYLNIKNKVKLTLFALIGLLAGLDGNYLVWFNSLFGEPMMITTLMLYIAAWVYYIYHRHELLSEEKIFSKIMFIILAAYLFLGAKMQVLSALPIILIMVGKLIWDNRRLLKTYQIWVLGLFYCILIIYPLNLNLNDQDNSNRQYNAVFYGILKDSKSPTQDLIDMGLNPDMAVDAGKHAFLDKSQYIKYVPHTQITQQEFYSKISNGKLVKFYLTHPARFLQGMEYTASQAFTTTTFLGKYARAYSETPIREFNRFTLWSSFREQYLPKNLWFLLSIYLVVLVISLRIYVKSQGLPEVKARIQLLWGIICLGLIQFPMPYVGNGEADTAKQLFLFNFVFDAILVVSICWSISKLIDFCYLGILQPNHPRAAEYSRRSVL
jgi:hypothetical protein